MNEILNKGGSLQGERHAGILWSTDDAFAQVMGKERCGHVQGVGFRPTPTRRSGANLPCSTSLLSSETAHRMTKLENSLMDQLAQSEQRHQEAIAALHALHKEEIAEMRAESDTRHEQQMAESKRQMDESKRQMDECLASMKAMLRGFGEFPSITQIMQVLKMLPLIYF